MGLRFFADHCVPFIVIEKLREAGHEALRLREHLPKESPDTIVIAKAQELDAILISLNGDFSDIVAYPPSRYRGIVGLQIRNHPEVIPGLMNRLTIYLASHPEMKHYRGRLFLVETHRIRSRN